MKKIILSIGLFGLMGIGLLANNSEELENQNAKLVSLSGQVVDVASGEVLSGVRILVEEENIHTYTDLDGNFTLDGLMPGTYQISTAFISYEKSVKKVDTNDSAAVKLSLAQISK